MVQDNDSKKWKDAILSILEGTGSSADEPLQVKKLRKQVLLSLQLDTDDKLSKKAFKQAVQALEQQKCVKLDSEGNIKLSKKRKRDSKEEKKLAKKKKPDEQNHDASVVDTAQQQPTVNESSEKNAPCKGNPQGCTRLFLGNLPFAVDEASLEAFIPGVTHIKWITDKETGKFYGSAFVEMGSSISAADAVAKAGSQLMGRPIKINFAPARPGDIWPPEKKIVSGNSSSGQAGGTGIKAMSSKPENCTKLFIGNLSYEIDDEGITKFFGNVDAQVKAIRWLHHKDTGDFKGVVSFLLIYCAKK
jgi:nucleolin